VELPNTKAKLKIPSREERLEAGKSLRKKCPRQSHGKVILGQGERDIVALIESSNEDRLENLIPIRHGRMLQSPFAYFRGTALIQAHDLARTPVSGIVVQVDMALKVVGVGSVGTACFVALLLAAPDDPLFLQVKQARPQCSNATPGIRPSSKTANASSSDSA
jgi:uncharacterized protein (DUF2252 family)